MRAGSRSALDREGEHAGVQLVDRVQRELDGGDDAEAAPPPRTAQKRSGRGWLGDDDAPVGGHDLDGDDAVGGQAVLAASQLRPPPRQ
jgi:hypothetical protein